MSDPKTRLVIDDQTGGRNGYEPPWALASNQCADAVNVDFYQSRFGRKANGATAVTLTSATITGVVSSAIRHVPNTDLTAAELWIVDDAVTPIVNRLAGGTAWSAPTLKDNPTGNGWDVNGASLDQKLFLAYKNAAGRMPVWDGSTVRRAGLAAPTGGAASPGSTGIAGVANGGGAGTYAAVQRFYRIRYTAQSSGVTIRRSEPGVATIAVTPDGAHANFTITISATAGEGETHWELEGSPDGVTFYVLATTAIGTTTYADTTLVSSYPSFPLSAATGTYTLPPNAKFVAADQNRLLMFGDYTSANPQNRVTYSAVIGSLSVGDAERVDTTINYYVTLDEKDSGVATGLAGPLYGTFLAFKDRQVWLLTATGQTSQPYNAIALTKSFGALNDRCIALGEDAIGNPAVYFMSHRGPYRYGLNGLEYLGHNIEDLILPTGAISTLNQGASKVVAHTVAYPDKQQVWFFWATGSNNDCDSGAIFHTRTGGWTRLPSGRPIAASRCSVLFSNTLGASMSKDLKPYIGQTGGNGRLWKCDTGTDDNGTAFQSYTVSRAVEPGGAGYVGQAGDAALLAQTASGVTLTTTVIRDFGVETKTATALLTATGSETRTQVRLEDSGYAGAQFLQYQVGDGAATSTAWNVDRLVVPVTRQDAVSA
jgi:hypothetical protein